MKHYIILNYNDKIYYLNFFAKDNFANFSLKKEQSIIYHNSCLYKQDLDVLNTTKVCYLTNDLLKDIRSTYILQTSNCNFKFISEEDILIIDVVK